MNGCVDVAQLTPTPPPSPIASILPPLLPTHSLSPFSLTYSPFTFFTFSHFEFVNFYIYSIASILPALLPTHYLSPYSVFLSLHFNFTQTTTSVLHWCWCINKCSLSFEMIRIQDSWLKSVTNLQGRAQSFSDVVSFSKKTLPEISWIFQSGLVYWMMIPGLFLLEK